ncbi:hypothetical protein CMEL01_11249 [Colletotrichum melonis]|uniref:Uncharacterized protein n=1 Tax=Colletotrichum melonis TaxID=1209925 RepID=A0AAI9UYN1_9PEZI|nr:hypothetical protein CMEL01_11249 [Colletotrichum melonis]
MSSFSQFADLNDHYCYTDITMPPTRTAKSDEAKKAANAAVYGARPAFQSSPSALSGAPGSHVEIPYYPLAPGNIKAEYPMPVKSEPQFDQGIPVPQLVPDTAAAMQFDTADFSDDEYLSFNEPAPAPKRTSKPMTARAPRPMGPWGSGHIDTVLSFKEICERLTSFRFVYHVVNYDATNSAEELTDDIIKTAHACPKLKVFSVPGTSDLTEKAFLAL